MILITKTDSNGNTRHCDERCYNAHDKKCDCICGGVNHGIGLARAMQNIEIVMQIGIPGEEFEKTESAKTAYNTQMSFLNIK